MLALIGAVLVVASILLFAWAVLGFRNPEGGAWRKRYLVLESVSCAIVGIFVFGLAMQLKFALEFEGAPGWMLVATALATPLIAYLAIWRWFGVKAKVARFDAIEAAAKPAAPPVAANQSKAA